MTISNNGKRILGAFCHGKLEDAVGNDILCVEGEFTPKEGLNRLTHNGKEVTLFLWEKQLHKGLHGLAVYNDDHESFFKVLDMYHEKPEIF